MTRAGVEAALREHDVHVTLSTPRLLSISQKTRAQICARVVEAAGLVEPGGHRVPLPEIAGHAALTVPGGFGNGQVTLQIGADLTSHLTAVEQVALTAVREKVDQARRGGWSADTLLVTDLSRLGPSWLRPDGVWAGRLAVMPIPWAITPFLGVVIVFSTLDWAGFDGASIGRPGLSSGEMGKLTRLVTSLGLVRHS
jgi:hypothetical protein